MLDQATMAADAAPWTPAAAMPWMRSHRADRRANMLAKRHYTCQHPESDQFVPPGADVTLLSLDATAVWTTSWPRAEYVRHAWAGSWVNSIFRNEGSALSSDLIRSAVAATRWEWPDAPPLGIVSFVDASQVRHKRDPGRCYRRAGWTLLRETTKGGLLVYQLLPADMPDPAPPSGAQLRLAGVA
jgi:hypothetical protein